MLVTTDSSLLKHLVKVSEDGFIANAVSLDMMADPQQNLDLCRGFVFNYNPDKPKESTLGILQVLRQSYHSVNEPNIHLLIQDFGKGKSHFALTISNFFKQPFDSPEVKGILDRIGEAIAGKSRAPLESLTTYKQRSRPHLVIHISGERVGDLKQAFLRSLRETLEAEGITDTIAQQLVRAPLNYLKNLTSEKRIKANEYLISQNFDGDLNSIIELLENDDYQQIPVVKEMSRAIEGGGLSFDGDVDLDIERILEEILTKLCKGENPKFEGILILFDELNAYLRGSSVNSTFQKSQIVLQNITNICERHKTHIALLCFAQVRPSGDSQATFSERTHYERYTTRLENTTYQPKASLELVLDNLILEISKPAWQDFRTRWDSALLAESQTVYEQFVTVYNSRNFPLEDFHRHLTLGCFPLHPLTTYLLCNLGFAQGRTMVQFIRQEVKEFIESEPVERNGVLNFIHPYRLINFFGDDNLKHHSVYPEYRKAYDTIAGSATSEELIVLKALFLYYVGGENLKKGSNAEKQDRISHDTLLAALTGFSKSKIKEILHRLCNEASVIQFLPATQIYRFYSGGTFLELKRLIEDKTNRDLEKNPLRLNGVVEECNRNSTPYFGSQAVTADRFVTENRLLSEDWQFGWDVVTIDGLQSKLDSQRLLHTSDKRGVLLQVFAETDQELQDLRKQVIQLLQKAPLGRQIVIALPRRGVKPVARLLLDQQHLNRLEAGEKREYSQAIPQYAQQLEAQISNMLKEIVHDSTLHSLVSEKIPLADRNIPHHVVSELMFDLYRLAPPVEGNDKMKLKSTAGSKVIGYCASRLFANDLTPQGLPKDNAYSNLINTVFVRRWGLLNLQYAVKVPTDKHIRAAWDRISELTDLGSDSEKRVRLADIWKALSDTPYGYNEFSFTMLFAGWLSYYRNEVRLKGISKIPQRASESVPVRVADLKEWSTSNILDKPRDFVNRWILQTNPELIRLKPLEIDVPDSVDYEKARQYLENLTSALETNTLEPPKQEEFRRKAEQLTKGISAIDEWLQPIVEAEASLENPDLETLIQRFPGLSSQYKQNFRAGVITVCLTQQQRDRQAQVQQAVGEAISQLITGISDRVPQFRTSEECGEYKVQIQNSINLLNQGPTLPAHLVEILEVADKKAEDRLTQIQEQQRMENCLAEAQALASSLKSDATQQEYQDTKARIESLAQTVPAISAEEIYVQAIQKIEQDYRTLNQKIDIWSEQSIGLDSSNCLAMIQEVSGQERRFTESASQQKVAALLKRLKVKVQEGQRLDDSHQMLQSALFPAKSALQRIRDLEIGKLGDILQEYEALQTVVLPTVDATVDVAEYEAQLTQLKESSINVITERADDVCGQNLRNLEEYDNLQHQIYQCVTLLQAYPVFSEVITRLNSASEKLMQQKRDLQAQAEEQRKQNEDNQRVQSVRENYRTVKINTFVFVEQGISTIQALQSQLHYPDVHQAELTQILQALQQKLSNHHAKLEEIRDRLSSITTPHHIHQLQNELADLVAIFRESSQDEACQALQQQAAQLQKDFQRLSDLETRSKNLSDLTAILQALETIEIEKAKFHNLTRFESQIAMLQSNLQQQIQKYAEELDRSRQRLIGITTRRAAYAFRDELLKQNAHYTGGNLEESYQRLIEEVNHLAELISIGDAIRRVNTLDDCNNNRAKLRHWQEECPQPTELLSSQFQILVSLLEGSEETIRQKLISDAQAGLRDLEAQAVEMYRSENEVERLEIARQLPRQIKTFQNEFAEYLTLDQQSSLERIEASCKHEREKNTANQIITLFQELPRSQRTEVYEKLSQYLPQLTEDFDG